MLGSQLQAIWNDETVNIAEMCSKPNYMSQCFNKCFKRFIILQGIEQLKKEQARWAKKSKWKSLQAVFGRFSVAWLSPFTKPPLSAREEYSYLPV